MSREWRVISTHLHPGVISDRYRAGATSAQLSSQAFALHKLWQVGVGVFVRALRTARLSSAYDQLKAICSRATKLDSALLSKLSRWPRAIVHEPRAKPPRMRRSKCRQVPFSEDYPFDQGTCRRENRGMGDVPDTGFRFSLSSKETIVLVAGTALRSPGSFRSDDPYVAVPMLAIAGISFSIGDI